MIDEKEFMKFSEKQYGVKFVDANTGKNALDLTNERRVCEKCMHAVKGDGKILFADDVVCGNMESPYVSDFRMKNDTCNLWTAISKPRRCPWGDTKDELMREYHDAQWGKPCFDERELFEMLILEGAQAGLSWSCVLHKRENYREAFDNFDSQKIAAYDETKIQSLLQNPGIIRNRLKINAAVINARLTLELGSLRDFIWDHVDGKPIMGHWENPEDIPVTTPLSDKISKDLKKRGFKFVGSTIIYSFMQAIGVVNDHMEWCAYKS
jgi:DNA-3-methyladenine glycosylase I